MIRIRWSSNAPQKEGDVTPTVADSGNFVLPDEVIERVRGGEEIVAIEGDPVATHVVAAVLHNIEQERLSAEDDEAIDG